MSDLTLSQLLACDPGPYAEAAAQWREWAGQVDDTAEVFARATRDLRDAWPQGEGAQAAHGRVAALRDEVSNAYQPALRIAQALQRLADGMVQLREYAEVLVAGARAHGLEVDLAAASVTAPQDMYRSGSPEHAAALVNSYDNDLRSVLERARGLDDDVTRQIAENVPDRVLGFGTAAPPPVGRSEVQALAGRDPAYVHWWWQSLTPVQQEQVIADFPDLVGWLDGVPATDRDTANRLRLAGDLAGLWRRAEELRRQVADTPEGLGGRYGNPRERLRDQLASVQADIDRLDTVMATLAGLGETGMLLGYDPAGDGKAILAVGNPDTAAHTAVWVPGVGTELDDIHGNTNRVKDLQQAADELNPDAAGDVAAIMWLGYDAPELDLSAVTHGRSEQGGQALDSFVDGLHVTHNSGQHTVTAIGHSYGSTVVAEAALRGDGLAVGDIVVAGSPGMHTDHAADLNIDPRHVWAGSALGDPVSDPYGYPAVVAGEAPGGPAGGGVSALAWAVDQDHGISPHRPEFGANQFHVDTTGHSAYWQKDSESLLNQARLVVGKYDAVTLDHGSPPS